jgi:hypothetical protein
MAESTTPLRVPMVRVSLWRERRLADDSLVMPSMRVTGWTRKNRPVRSSREPFDNLPVPLGHAFVMRARSGMVRAIAQRAVTTASHRTSDRRHCRRGSRSSTSHSALPVYCRTTSETAPTDQRGDKYEADNSARPVGSPCLSSLRRQRVRDRRSRRRAGGPCPLCLGPVSTRTTTGGIASASQERSTIDTPVPDCHRRSALWTRRHFLRLLDGEGRSYRLALPT